MAGNTCAAVWNPWGNKSANRSGADRKNNRNHDNQIFQHLKRCQSFVTIFRKHSKFKNCLYDSNGNHSVFHPAGIHTYKLKIFINLTISPRHWAEISFEKKLVDYQFSSNNIKNTEKVVIELWRKPKVLENNKWNHLFI